GIVLVVDSGDAFTTMIASIPPNERRDFQATIEAIAGSFSYILNSEAEATPEMTAEMTSEAEATTEMTSEAEATAEMTSEATESADD
ncbi:MAG: hypothetical protein AAFR67_16665, partial [Chloroflexota bacterium]